MSRSMTRSRVWSARGIALVADGIQWLLVPLFAGGAPEGADLVVDLVTAALLTWLCGFHLAFLPAVVAEALPVIDLFPTWTAATLFVTRKGAALTLESRRDS